mmetsp:Transcript_38939/g.100817  ORF Transcript_38939/g.100817 Transcript_38939/m.100817 type:complete len:363 (-) Transcript_38939:270-1358(-)
MPGAGGTVHVQLLVAIRGLADPVRGLEQTVAQHHLELPAHHIVDLRAMQEVQVPGGEIRLTIGAADPRHLLIHALRGSEGMEGPPIALHPTFESHGTFQVGQQQIRISACMHAVDRIVRAHDGRDTSIHCSLEGRVVHFPERARVDDAVHAVAVGFLVVRDEVLHNCQHTLGLHTLDVRNGQTRAEVGGLARDVLCVATPPSDAVHVHPRAEDHVGAFHFELFGQRDRPPLRVHLAPSRCDCQAARPARHLAHDAAVEGAEALAVVVHVEGWDAEGLVLGGIANVILFHVVVPLPADALQEAILLILRHGGQQCLHQDVLPSGAALEFSAGQWAGEAPPRGEWMSWAAGISSAHLGTEGALC